MPSLLHLSDLHFGSFYVPHLGELVLQEIETLHPDIVVVSGDLSYRARDKEFAMSSDWLNRIPNPLLTIPGNHDQTIFNPLTRLIVPVRNYEKRIGRAQNATLDANGFFVVGLNDNRPILPGGFWSPSQRTWLQRELRAAKSGTVRVIASHHQMMWDGKLKPAGFWYPSRAFELLSNVGVELVLNGHTHIPSAEQTREGIVVSRASTATCTRTRRGEGNSFNLITVDDKQIIVYIHRHDQRADRFVAEEAFTFARTIHKWTSKK